MWLFKAGLLSRVLPVALLIIITCITFVLKSIAKEVDAVNRAKARSEVDSDPEVEISDEDETVDVETDETVNVELQDDTEEVTIEPVVEESVVSTPITQIQGLPPKAIKALKEAKIYTVEQAASLSDEYLLNLNGVGAKTIKKIRIFKI